MTALNPTTKEIPMPPTRTLRADFYGTWCDNCRTAYSWMPADGNCPQCGPFKLRRAKVTVEPMDVSDEEWVRAAEVGGS